MRVVEDIVRLVRPRDWLKNVFVLLPLPFAVGAGSTPEPATVGLGLVAMSLTSSAAYVFNDWWDVERDRLHPGKRRRPIAAGRIPGPAAGLLSLGLMLAGTVVAASGPRSAVGLVLSYAALQLLYTLWGKHVALLDVFLLSAGFVLRVALGCALAGVRPSNWLLLCSSSLALFLSVAKRRADLMQGLDARHRPALEGYSPAFLDQIVTVSAGLTITAYALYCMDVGVLTAGWEFASVPFVVFGVLEYLRVVSTTHSGGSPIEVVLSSRALMACGAAWTGTILAGVSLGM